MSHRITQNKDMGLKEKSKQLRSPFQLSNCLLPKIQAGVFPIELPTCAEVHSLRPSQPARGKTTCTRPWFPTCGAHKDLIPQ